MTKPNIVGTPRRVCFDCDQFGFEGPERGYSEHTPGCDMRMWCNSGHWGVGTLYNICGSSEFADLLTKATQCTDFSQTEYSKQRYGVL